MKIWVDADACPKAIKEVLYRAANRTCVQVVFVANQPLHLPGSPFIRQVTVGAGFDVADQKITELLESGDLVITADIPLAAAAIQKNATALDPRGELYTPSNIPQRLSVRNFTEGLRNSGLLTGGGPGSFGKREVQAFSNCLDRYLALARRQKNR